MRDIFCGNPTCQYCGATYGIAEIHNCPAKQEAMRIRKEESISRLEKELSEARITLRDQFAMAVLVGFAKNYRQATAYSKGGNVDKGMQLDAKLAYGMADAMLKARND